MLMDRVSHLSLYFEGWLDPEVEQKLVADVKEVIRGYVGVTAAPIGGIDNLEAH
ncbi:hypothetical protein SEA_DELORIS_84 [Mycobacterium phage Deloris]|nr:hypothetical protein SEA_BENGIVUITTON_84 [Mycobacterium phage BengiVuitton]UXE04077.1 hypothetical protein SEA_DELORIS_84 [Mycobacterium phage Deloris]